ncbi:hypothetical protein L218DRAFT_453072 [Marasmius fiardii PR-910]|nr:hypothetical protein L218DRAFT_453072 [Marasmius fiardii PR-910]
MLKETEQTHCYRNHQAESMRVVPCPDLELLMELRARQRTFNGGYVRATLGTLTYALMILRIFDSRFHIIGFLFALQAAFFFVIAFYRNSRLKHVFNDENDENMEFTAKAHIGPDYNGLHSENKPTRKIASLDCTGMTPTGLDSASPLPDSPCSTKQPEPNPSPRQTIGTVSVSGQRIFGRPVLTAGWLVIVVSVTVLSTEVALIWEIMKKNSESSKACEWGRVASIQYVWPSVSQTKPEHEGNLHHRWFVRNCT